MMETEKNNDYCRTIKIGNYRNIGVSEPTEMTINRSLEKDKIGGLNIIVGPNNSGKSNVLDAIESFSNGINDSDKPEFFFMDAVGKPSVSMIVYDHGTKKEIKPLTNKKKSTKSIIKPFDYGNYEGIDDKKLTEKIKKNGIEPVLRDIVKRSLQSISKSYPEERLSGCYSADERGTNARSFLADGDHIDLNKSMEFLIRVHESYGNVYVNGRSAYVCGSEVKNYICPEEAYFMSLHTLYKKYEEYKDDIKKAPVLENETNLKDDEKETVADSEFFTKYGFKRIPKIVRYTEEPIKQVDMLSWYKPFNPFMTKVLGLTFGGNGVMKVKEAHEKYESGNSSAFLSKTKERLNEDAKAFSSTFNNLYLTDGIPYKFEFSLMENKIGLEIYFGDEPLDLDRQSTGFKWFFNFFFNFLCKRDLEPGDIVIMDEPATNLHVSGQIELANFIRKFAVRTGISFIISTHSPFMIDCDYLDEVRVVSRCPNGTSKIEDKFSVIEDKNPDKMDQILKSLTVGRHVLMNPKNRLFFVEGITDYNYLTAFKHHLGFNNISFMPINGVGQEKDSNRRQRIISSLMELDRSPVLIVDGDENGEDMKKASEGTGLSVITLKDIDPKFTVIESLFDKEDAKKFIPNKEWHMSSIFKQYIDDIAPELNETTINNFKKLLSSLENE